jgi:CRISPR/Cas system CSM-associated protein Csm4 (group 5 of RAMP superfamily)
MAHFSIIKLTNMSPLHIGSENDNYDSSSDSLQSDTISSAIAAIRAQNGRIDDLMGLYGIFFH